VRDSQRHGVFVNSHAACDLAIVFLKGLMNVEAQQLKIK
jgi:hypothetical protein